MRRLGLLFGLGVLIAAAFLVLPAFGANGTTTCNGTLAAGTYNRVVVPPDGVCLSDGPVRIRAGLFVQQGGTLVFGSEENAVHTATINGGKKLTVTDGSTRARSGRKSSNRPCVTVEMVSRATGTVWLLALGAK